MLRKSSVPEGGWTAERFQTPHGAAMLHDIYHARLAVLAPAIAKFTTFMRTWLAGIGRDALHRFTSAMHARGQRSIKAPLEVTVDLGSLAPLWSRSITQALEGAGIEVVIHSKPAMQSVAAATHERTAILIGSEPNHTATQRVTRKIDALARQVTRINEGTRDRLEKLLQQSHRSRATVAETVERMRLRIPEIAASRAPTIARTELARASDEGMKQAYRDNPQITHISVIGCEAVEPNIPTYRGIPTCNIQNVPVADMDALEFHINHTGCMVPSQFLDEQGRAPYVRPHEGYDGQDHPSE